MRQCSGGPMDHFMPEESAAYCEGRQHAAKGLYGNKYPITEHYYHAAWQRGFNSFELDINKCCATGIDPGQLTHNGLRIVHAGAAVLYHA